MTPERFDAVYRPTMTVRDLGSMEPWERSLARSRQRRRLTEVGRRARRRRKSVSLAMSAALAAAPVLPRGIAAADSGSAPSPATSTDSPTRGLLNANAQRVVLAEGSHGALVAALQRRLNQVLPLTYLAVDGIFGPLTRGAVLDFQRRLGLMASGEIDVRTWAVMFKAPVLVMAAASDSSAAAPSAAVSATAPIGSGCSGRLGSVFR